MEFFSYLKNIITSILLPFGGATVVILALSSWLGKVWAARILEQDRIKYQEKLEQLKNEIQRSQVILNASLNNYSIGNQVAQERRLNTIDAMWKGMLELQECAKDAIFFYDILMAKEYNDAFKNEKIMDIISGLSHETFINRYKSVSKLVQPMRPYLGENLWGLFSIYQALIGRFTYLLIDGKEKQSIKLWQLDSHIDKLASTILTKDDIETSKKMLIGGPKYILQQIEFKALIEMERLISGERSGEQSLKNAKRFVQAIQEFDVEESRKKKL